MDPVPDEKKKGWEAEINGEPFDLRRLTLRSRFGTLEYGQRSEGYDSWVFTEAGYGGAVTIPYCRGSNGELLIGLREENRANMGGKRLCAIGGFLNTLESHQDAQRRESKEEAGLDSVGAIAQGVRYNCNRAFFVADPEKGQGIQAHGLAVSSERLERSSLPGSVGKMGSVEFFEWTDAVTQLCGDAIALAAIAQVRANIEREERKNR